MSTKGRPEGRISQLSRSVQREGARRTSCFEHGTVIDLAPRQTLRLPDQRGTTLRITRGTAWVTQHNDSADVVLRTGDTWVVERNGLTILEAQADTTVCVVGRRLNVRVESEGASTLLAPWWQSARSALARFASTPTRSPTPYY